MNPRHRRLLIPGLLVALLVIVVVSSLADRAGATTSADEPVSRIDDARITESSGLAISETDPDLAYTVNDSGNAAAVYSIEISTGRVVGSAIPSVAFTDTEALSIDSEGTVWVADTGDNNRQRDDIALYSMRAPGRQDVGATPARRFPLTYPDGPRDVEALVIDPRTDRKLLLTKGLLGGEVFALPERLVADRPNRVTALDATVPGMITDAASTPDGAHVVARNYSRAFVLDAQTWKRVDTIDLPQVSQGETLAAAPDGESFLVGSEGSASPLFRVPLSAPEPAPATASSAPAGAAGATDQGPPSGGNGFAGATWLWAGLLVLLLAVVSVAATRRS